MQVGTLLEVIVCPILPECIPAMACQRCRSPNNDRGIDSQIQALICFVRSSLQFALKPCENLLLETMRLSQQHHKLQGVACRACNVKIGNLTSQLPSREALVVFGSGKVEFVTSCGAPVKLPSGQKGFWAKTMKHPAFCHVHRGYDYGEPLKPLPSHLLAPSTPLVTPTSPNCPLPLGACLEWRDCVDELSGFTPRREQIDAFRRCVLHNHIVALPTGFGKTLIASMVMARMASLNPAPGRLALMLVDRIPLVEQQKLALENHTGLIAASLCSETNTRLNKQNLFSGSVEALVATAGALFHLLHEKS